MHRRTQRDTAPFWRQLSPRYIKVIMTIFAGFFLLNVTVYLTTKYMISPGRIRPTTEASTTETTTTTTTAPTTVKSFELGCYFDQTNITLADGSIQALNTLKTGQEVLVYSASSKQFEKSPILTIFHHKRSSVRFLDIYTTNNQQPLRLTPSHSILTKKSSNKQSSFDYDFAYNLQIGDGIFSSNMESVSIVNIKEVILFNQTISTPLTFEGNIIVNNLIGSCYATYNHQFMHLLTTPLRYWYQIETFSHLNCLITYFIDFYSMITF